jgi:hypothetical protein
MLQRFALSRAIGVSHAMKSKTGNRRDNAARRALPTETEIGHGGNGPRKTTEPQHQKVERPRQQLGGTQGQTDQQPNQRHGNRHDSSFLVCLFPKDAIEIVAPPERTTSTTGQNGPLSRNKGPSVI